MKEKWKVLLLSRQNVFDTLQSHFSRHMGIDRDKIQFLNVMKLSQKKRHRHVSPFLMELDKCWCLKFVLELKYKNVVLYIGGSIKISSPLC